MTEATLEVDAAAPAADPPAIDTTTPQTTDTKPATGLVDPSAAKPVAETPPAETDKDTSDWPEDWRDKLADGNEEYKKAISRYGSPKGIVKALHEAQQLIRSGKLKRDAPDPTDEKAMAEWRKEQGVPDKPEAYKLPEVKGYDWSDADKAVAADYFDAAHKAGLPQAVVDANLAWYTRMVNNAQEQQVNADKAASTAAEDALRKDWAPGEYRSNMELAKRFMADAPIGADWTEARLPNGKLLGSIPEFIAWASDRGRAAFGETSFIAGDGQVSRGAARLEEIRKMQASGDDKYWTKEIQAEELKLLDEQSRSKR